MSLLWGRGSKKMWFFYAGFYCIKIGINKGGKICRLLNTQCTVTISIDKGVVKWAVCNHFVYNK